MNKSPATRRFPLVAIGVLLIVIAAVLVALVATPRPKKHIDAGSEARIACRAFEDVYGATKPGMPMNGRALATRLDQSIAHMHTAASADAQWKDLASSLDDLGRAVNAGDAPGSYALMQSVHQGCSSSGTV